MKKGRIGTPFVIATVLLLLGMGFFLFPAYRFSAYLSLGCAMLSLCFGVLGILQRRQIRWARIGKRMLIVFLCLGLAAAIVTGAFVVSGSRGNGDRSCDYLIVLGAGVNGTVPSLSLQDRLIAARDYLQDNPQTICIVSGGQGRGEAITEAACMADWLIRQGIDPERIWLEERATSTRENILYSLDLVESRTGIRPVTAGIVSSEYHLFRAGLLAKSLGLESVGIPAATHRTSLKINYFLREIVAVWYFLVFGG